MTTMILVLATIAASVVYICLLAYRIGLGRGRHARIWSKPRPLQLLAHGEHEAPRAAPTPRESGPAGEAVAA
ncbi:hypothetical protein ACFHW2_12225 [Actinomadura sp. LOL_016]|uniref:hypothetical protein n=1 Tax=unclassified Actinomadura TaxID=2626254 RepID=UPI003A813035